MRSSRRPKSSSSMGGLSELTSSYSRPYRFRFRVNPWFVAAGNSGDWGLIANIGALPSTTATNVPISPFYIGGRFKYIAAMFARYKINKCRITYVPMWLTSSGAEEVTAAQGATGSAALYYNRAFAWGFQYDPAWNIVGTNSIVEMGGRFGRVTQASTLRLNGATPWCYTGTSSTAATPPTVVDDRMCQPVSLNFIYLDSSNGTGGPVYFGGMLVDLDVSFMEFLPETAPIGAVMRPLVRDGKQPSEYDEKGIEMTQLNTKGSTDLVQLTPPKCGTSSSESKRLATLAAADAKCLPPEGPSPQGGWYFLGRTPTEK